MVLQYYVQSGTVWAQTIPSKSCWLGFPSLPCLHCSNSPFYLHCHVFPIIVGFYWHCYLMLFLYGMVVTSSPLAKASDWCFVKSLSSYAPWTFLPICCCMYLCTFATEWSDKMLAMDSSSYHTPKLPNLANMWVLQLLALHFRKFLLQTS